MVRQQVHLAMIIISITFNALIVVEHYLLVYLVSLFFIFYFICLVVCIYSISLGMWQGDEHGELVCKMCAFKRTQQ